jgi:hypothetical protein
MPTRRTPAVSSDVAIGRTMKMRDGFMGWSGGG